MSNHVSYANYLHELDRATACEDAAVTAAAEGDLDRAHDLWDAATHHATRARGERRHAESAGHHWATADHDANAYA